MTAILGLALILAAAFGILISIVSFLFMIKVISMAFIMGFVVIGLAVAGLIASLAHYTIVGVGLIVLASLITASSIVLFAKNSAE